MKKTNIWEHEPGSAAFVIAHAQWQRSRGRRPSLPYRHTRNPAKALLHARATRLHELAKANGIGIYGVNTRRGKISVDLHTNGHYSWSNRAVRAGITLAQQMGEPVWFTYDFATVLAQADSDPAQLVAEWDVVNRRQKARWAKYQAAKRQAVQRQVDRLYTRLGVLDFRDMPAVMRFMSEVADVGDRGGNFNSDLFLAIFERYGFKPNAHVGKDPKAFEGNHQMLGEYLLGQALDGICSFAKPMPVFSTFASEWIKEFEKNS